MRRVLMGAVLGLTLAAGCGGEPTFDATSDATMKASIERMSAGLSPQDRLRFLRGAMGPTMRAAARSGVRGQSAAAHESARSLHGLTAREIMAKGDEAAAAQAR